MTDEVLHQCKVYSALSSNTRKEARILEKKLKSGYGKEFLKNL